MFRPIIVKGAANEAVVYAKTLEAKCEDKILQYLNNDVFAGTKVRIMSDVHLGKSTVIGFTAVFGDTVIPSLVGTDGGCGICACNLGKGNLKFDKLDRFIRKNIPAGMDIRTALHEGFTDPVLKNRIRGLCDKTGRNVQRAFNALGTLGGGNHFIEIDRDENQNRWLLVHTGSRILGAWVAEYHEITALRKTPEESPIKYLRGDGAVSYLADMETVRAYARCNRRLIAETIVQNFFKQDMEQCEYIDCVHNFYDLDASIVRKGAISAKNGERVVIPFSMAEGAIIATGKGNADWNCSAPHGAGRKIARTQARNGLSLDEYRREMRGVWSSTVCKDTLDESPMAYKKARDILDCITDTVEIQHTLVPLYNFKAID